MGKIRSRKVNMFGRVWDSQTELDYYIHLREQDDIESIELQPVYTLIPRFYLKCRSCNGSGRAVSEKTGREIQCKACKGKGKRGRHGAVYTADFKVRYKDGHEEVIDVKGHANEAFPMRKKLFEYTTGQELIIVKRKGRGWERT